MFFYDKNRDVRIWLGLFCFNNGLQYYPFFSLKRCILLFPVSLCQIVVPKITTDKANHGKFLAAWNEDHNHRWQKKKKKKAKPWQISCSMKWRSQQQMLVEQKMLINVLVVCLTIEFWSDWFSEITFTIWDQHFKEAWGQVIPDNSKVRIKVKLLWIVKLFWTQQ